MSNKNSNENNSDEFSSGIDKRSALARAFVFSEEQITINTIFDFVRNLTVSATVVAIGTALAQGKLQGFFASSIIVKPLAWSLVFIGFGLYILNLLQGISLIRNTKNDRAVTYIYSAALFFVSITFLLGSFLQMIKSLE